MAMTQLTLIFIGGLATLTTAGLGVTYADKATQAVVAFAAALFWAIFGMSAFDVYVNDAATKSEPITPLAYLGIGLAVIVGLFAFWLVLQSVRSETEDVDLGNAFK